LRLEYQIIRRQSIARLRRAFPDHDLGQDFLLDKTPRPIACRALVFREKLFDVGPNFRLIGATSTLFLINNAVLKILNDHVYCSV
jgi:hypothetical protein